MTLQHLGVCKNSSTSITLRTGAPGRCVLSLLLLTLLAHDGVPTYSTNYIVFAGDFIANEKMSQLVQWCKDNNFFFKVEKTKKIVQKILQHQVPGSAHHLSCTDNTVSLARKAQGCLYFLRKLRRAWVLRHYGQFFWECHCWVMLDKNKCARCSTFPVCHLLNR